MFDHDRGRSVTFWHGLLGLLLSLALVASIAAFANGQRATLVLGHPTFTTRTSGTSATSMKDPRGIAVDPATGKVFVVDTGNNRVLRFGSSLALASGAAAEAVLGQPDFTSSVDATTATGMRFPASAAIDGAGRLWVADLSNHRVLRFDNAASKANGAAADGVLGQANFTSNTPATSATRMRLPVGVAIDNAGRLWVADTSNHRVLRFDNAASKANGAAADGVLGQVNFTSSELATSATGMLLPHGVAADNNGRLWVIDTDNHRVLRFDSAASKANGAAADGVLGQTNFTSKIFDVSASRFTVPRSAAVDASGRLWLIDENNDRVLRFDNAASKANGAAADGVLGQPDFTSDEVATSQRGLYSPYGVAIDSANNIWVADRFNNRAVRFDRLVPPEVSWSSPAAISYGTPLSAAQLNASADVAGSFRYQPPLGTVLNAGVGQPLVVQFTPNDTNAYATAILTVTIDVNPVAQTITFAALGDRALNESPFSLSASASSGLPVSFSSATPGVCSVNGGMLTLLAAGLCTIYADQSGNGNISAAPRVSRSFEVLTSGTGRKVYLPLVMK